MTLDEGLKERAALIEEAGPLHDRLLKYAKRLNRLYETLRWEGIRDGSSDDCPAETQSQIEMLYEICPIIDSYVVDVSDNAVIEILRRISKLKAT